VPVSTPRLLLFLAAAERIGLDQHDDVRHAAVATLASSPEEVAIVERLFAGLFAPTAEPPESLVPGPEAAESAAIESTAPLTQPADRPPSLTDLDLDAEGEGGSRALYSRMERLLWRDFADYTDAELDEARRFLSALRWRLPMRRSRRRERAKHGRDIDVRRLLRSCRPHQGEIVSIPRARAKLKPRKLVLLCDVSGSMDVYTRMLLHLLHSLGTAFRRTEIFLFSTRLTRITSVLADADIAAALPALSEEVHDWSGGTRIGEVLRSFNRDWSRRVGAHGAVIMIISDGWDRGDVQLLQREMARLRRTSHALIWLNPLLGSSGYSPLTQGMQAALPHTDRFLSVRNLASLESLATDLNTLAAPHKRLG